MPPTNASDPLARTINGRRYIKSRGRLLQLGDDVPAAQARNVLGVAPSHEDGKVSPIIADLTVDGEAVMQRLIAGTGARDFDPHEPDPMREEIGRLLDLGLVNAAEGLKTATGYKDPAPLGPLDLGQILMDPSAIGLRRFTGIVRGNCHLSVEAQPFNAADVRELLRRHAGGDHGAFGKSADVAVTGNLLWGPEAFSWPERNAAATAAGRGLVRAAYSVDLLPKARLDPRFNSSWIVRPQLEHLDVVTLIGRMTVVWPRWSNVGF